MHPEPEKSNDLLDGDSHKGDSLKGGDKHRRQRAVHKIRLSELHGFTRDEISRMVASGDIELMVRQSDIADDADGGWSHRLASLFESVAASLDGAPEHENRTIFVNIVAGGPHKAR